MGSKIKVGDKIICLVAGLFVNKELVITEIDKIFFWAYCHDSDTERISFTISNKNKTYKRAKKKIG